MIKRILLIPLANIFLNGFIIEPFSDKDTEFYY